MTAIGDSYLTADPRPQYGEDFSKMVHIYDTADEPSREWSDLKGRAAAFWAAYPADGVAALKVRLQAFHDEMDNLFCGSTRTTNRVASWKAWLATQIAAL